MRNLIIAFIILSSLSGGLRAQDANITATVSQTVNVRGGPGTQFEIVGQLNDGDVVPVLGRDSSASRWLYVTLPDDKGSGWVAVFTVTLSADPQNLEIVGAGDAQDTPVPPTDGVQITAFGRVNVRSGPAITYETVGQLESGDAAQATARSNYNNDWLYIENETLTGWLAYFTVSVRGNPDDLPVLVPDTATGKLVPPATLIHAQYNVHLHVRPALGSRITGTVPFDAQVAPLGITQDGHWLYVAFDTLEGWAWAALFDMTDEQMALIPRRASPSPTLTPVPTVTATD